MVSDRQNAKARSLRSRPAPNAFTRRDDSLRIAYLLSRFRGLGLRYGPVGCTHLEARKAPHGDILAEFANFLRDQFLDADSLVLDKRLLKQANLFIELCHLALEHFLDDIRRLA